MAKVYTEEELNSFSRETLMAVILSMQDQISQLNINMECLIEQIADANNKECTKQLLAKILLSRYRNL